MNTLLQVSHDLRTNTLEAVWINSAGERNCRSFSPIQVEEFKEVTGEFAGRYINLAGWTLDYIATIEAEEKRLAKEAQDKADAEEAERKKEAQKKFDEAVAAQVAILEAAKKTVAAKG